MSNINNRETSKALFKNTGIIAIGQISTKLISFCLLPLYTALLTTEEYGLIDLLSTYSSFLAVIIGLQMSQALFRFLATCREDEKRNGEIISTTIFVSLCIWVLYAIIFGVIQPFVNLQHKWYLLYSVLASTYCQTMSGIARGMGKNTDYAAGNFISAALTLVLNVLFIAVFRLGVQAMLIAYIIGPLIGGTFLLLRTKLYRYIKFSRFNMVDAKTILKYSIPLVPNELSWSIIHTSDRMIVSNVLGVAANGLIAVASKFSVIYTTAFSVFNTSWTEQVVLHYNDKGGKEYISDMFEKMVTFFGCIAIGIIACMPFVFGLFVNEQFGESYGLIPVYMIAVFFNAVIGMISSVYLINNETRQVAVSTFIAAVINIAVDLLLINHVGTFAAPISSICGYAAISVWRLYDVNKRHCKIKMSFKNIILLCGMLIVSCVSFYSKITLVQIVVLAVIAGMAVLLNLPFFKELLEMLFKKKKSE